MLPRLRDGAVGPVRGQWPRSPGPSGVPWSRGADPQSPLLSASSTPKQQQLPPASGSPGVSPRAADKKLPFPPPAAQSAVPRGFKVLFGLTKTSGGPGLEETGFSGFFQF